MLLLHWRRSSTSTDEMFGVWKHGGILHGQCLVDSFSEPEIPNLYNSVKVDVVENLAPGMY